MIGDFRSPYKYRFTIHASLMKANELGKPFFQYDKLEQAIQANIQAGKRGVREVFGQISMPLLVTDSLYSGLEYFDCALIPGNIGWFHTDTHHITRYYSKSRKTKDIVNLDVVDFFAIEMEMTKKEAIVWLRGKFAFQNSQEDEAERARLNELLEQGIHMEQVHGEVFNARFFRIYRFLLDQAESSLCHRQIGQDGTSRYFFSSIDFLNQAYFDLTEDAVSRATFAAYINYMVTVGFVKKLGLKSVSNRDATNAQAITESKTFAEKYGYGVKYNRNTMNFYHMAAVSPEEAVEKAEKLTKAGVHIHQISKSTVSRVFGKAAMEAVYPEAKYQRTKPEKHMDEKKRFRSQFFFLLKRQGYVLKAQLTGILNKNMTNKFWTALVKETSGVKKRLSSEIRKNLRLKESETGDVFFSYAFLYHPNKDDFWREGGTDSEKSKKMETIRRIIPQHDRLDRLLECG